MQIGEISEMSMSELFELVEKEGGTYEVETPQGWIEIGDMKREEKECFLLRTAEGLALEAAHDHLVETQNGWEKVEDLNIERTVVNTRDGQDKVVAREYIGIQNTFDFEVLHDEHKYYADGIVSHNCGKTLSCRWLRDLCRQHNLAHRAVSMQDYMKACSQGRSKELFSLYGQRSGIIFFDDMDVMVRNRKQSGVDLSTFLSELDGLDPAHGIVFVFTTNYIKELDEAFVRPGRIDLWLPFGEPSEKLRRKFVEKRFNEELLNQLDIEEIVKRSNEYSFAELEEIRKLFCFDLIDEKPIDLEKTFTLFAKHRKDFEQRAVMGFGTLQDEDDNEDYDDENPFDESWIPRPLRGAQG